MIYFIVSYETYILTMKHQLSSSHTATTLWRYYNQSTFAQLSEKHVTMSLDTTATTHRIVLYYHHHWQQKWGFVRRHKSLQISSGKCDPLPKPPLGGRRLQFCQVIYFCYCFSLAHHFLWVHGTVWMTLHFCRADLFPNNTVSFEQPGSFIYRAKYSEPKKQTNKHIHTQAAKRTTSYVGYTVLWGVYLLKSYFWNIPQPSPKLWSSI